MNSRLALKLMHLNSLNLLKAMGEEHIGRQGGSHSYIKREDRGDAYVYWYQHTDPQTGKQTLHKIVHPHTEDAPTHVESQDKTTSQEPARVTAFNQEHPSHIQNILSDYAEDKGKIDAVENARNESERTDYKHDVEVDKPPAEIFGISNRQVSRVLSAILERDIIHPHQVLETEPEIVKAIAHEVDAMFKFKMSAERTEELHNLAQVYTVYGLYAFAKKVVDNQPFDANAAGENNRHLAGKLHGIPKTWGDVVNDSNTLVKKKILFGFLRRTVISRLQRSQQNYYRTRVKVVNGEKVYMPPEESLENVKKEPRYGRDFTDVADERIRRQQYIPKIHDAVKRLLRTSPMWSKEISPGRKTGDVFMQMQLMDKDPDKALNPPAILAREHYRADGGKGELNQNNADYSSYYQKYVNLATERKEKFLNDLRQEMGIELGKDLTMMLLSSANLLLKMMAASSLSKSGGDDFNSEKWLSAVQMARRQGIYETHPNYDAIVGNNYKRLMWDRGMEGPMDASYFVRFNPNIPIPDPLNPDVKASFPGHNNLSEDVDIQPL